MHEVLPESGVIRKLWIGETADTASMCCGSIPRAG